MCVRCQARNRKGAQCGKAAIRGKSVCRNHGGLSCGPVSESGKDQVRSAHWVHGRRSQDSTRKNTFAKGRLRQIEDALRLLGAVEGSRLKGRKPGAYTPVTSVEQLHKFVDSLVNGDTD
jgi:hypothetical protein